MPDHDRRSAFRYRIADPAERTVARMLSARAAATPDRTCLIWNGDERITFAELDERARRVAAGLSRLGVGRGDRVAVIAQNCPEYVALIFGIAHLGAVIVTVNVHARGPQLRHILANSEPSVVVVQSGNLAWVEQGMHDLSLTVPVVILDPAAEQGPAAPAPARLPSREAFGGEPWAASPDARHSDLAQILYTSGTTGPSKGVMISHNQAYAFADYVAQAMELTDGDVYYTCLPLFHVNAQLTVLAGVLTGATVALYERFSASAFWSQIRHVEATAVSLFGAMAYILYKQPPEHDAPTPLRVCWAFPAPYDILADFEKRYALKVLTAYASTEANFVAISGVRERPPAGSVGQPHPRFEVKVVNEDDEEVPPGTIGEIVTRPLDPYTMMDGYYAMPGVTAAAFRNLWYHTGDAGRFDAGGYLYFVDRIKDVIRRRGENISSYEVEEVITSHPDVAECAVVAVRSELSEDEVMAVIVPSPGRRPRPEEITDWCRERMAYFMVPRFIRFVAELPKTPTGKVEKYRLQDGPPADTWAADNTPGRNAANLPAATPSPDQ